MLMDKPLQLTFHNLEHSDAVEADVRERMEKLNDLYDRITSARIVVDSPHRTSQRAKAFTVRIELGLPKTELVISREPVGDIHAAVVDAFDTAKRRLRDYVSKHRNN